MALQLRTIVNSIAGLDVDGVRILNDPPADLTRLTPVMFPEPVDFLSDFAMVRDSFGGGSVAKMTVDYSLHYTFCYAPVGAGRTGLDIYIDMLEKVGLILDAILAIDVIDGAVDLVPTAVSEMGGVPDPAGNTYLGCRITIHTQEFVNG